MHWNFFLTLAALFILVAVFNVIFGSHKFGFIGVVLAYLYQFLLSNTGLQSFLLNDDRSNLFYMNKEGIVSVTGYLSLFMIGVQVGHLFFDSNLKTVAQWRKNYLKLVGLTLIFWALYLFNKDILGIQSSRRFVNYS